MNLNISVKYQLYDNKKGIVIYYGVLFLVIILMVAFVFFPSGNINIDKGNMRGMEISTVIFLFAAGLNSFREIFRMFMQNGVSRKTMFTGRLICVSWIGLAMALIDNIIAIICKQVIPSVNRNVNYSSFFEMLYEGRYESSSSNTLMFFEGILFMFFLYAMISMFGYFISLLYYRMNKGTKIAVSVGVPVMLFTVLPLLDSLIFNRALIKLFERLVFFAFGFSNGSNPYFGVVTLLLTFAVFSGLSWLLLRKAVVKD